MESVTSNSFALVAEAFDDRIAREALVLATLIRASANAAEDQLPKI